MYIRKETNRLVPYYTDSLEVEKNTSDYGKIGKSKNRLGSSPAESPAVSSSCLPKPGHARDVDECSWMLLETPGMIFLFDSFVSSRFGDFYETLIRIPSVYL